MKDWYYIDSWIKEEATWGTSSWRQASGIGPMRMDPWEAKVWAETEQVKQGPNAVVRVWRWTGSQWVKAEPGTLSKVGETGAGVSVGVSLGGLFWMGLAGVAGYYACKKRLI